LRIALRSQPVSSLIARMLMGARPGTWQGSERLTAGRLFARKLSSHPNSSRLLEGR
jgi:hypothetical protein